MSKKDYYSLLEISKTASSDEIKKAYRKLAMKYHPDQNKGNTEAEAKFKEISEAYEVLKDEQKRAAYDRFGHDAFTSSGGGRGGYGGGQGFGGQSGFHSQGFHGDFSDLFGDFFSNSGRRRNKKPSQERGSDLKYNLTISLEEAFTGVEKNISFTTNEKCKPCDGKGSNSSSHNTCHVCDGHGAVRIQQGFFAVEQECSTCGGSGQILQDPCKSCRGQGRSKAQKTVLVSIPAGVEEGNRIKISGEGEAGVRGGPAGDLYVFIALKTHELFRLDGSDIHCMIPISFKVAALGGEVQVPTIDGSIVALKIPEGTQNGEKLKLKSKGMSKVRSSIRGDMIVHIFVEVPKTLTNTQKKLLEEFDSQSPKDSDGGFFQKMKNLWSNI